MLKKKSYTVICRGKNSYRAKSSIPPPPQKSNGQPLRSWGKKWIWHLSKCHPSTKWLTHVHHVVVFKTKVLHFKIENTPIKYTNRKSKFKRMLCFLFADRRKVFAMKLSFEQFFAFFTADWSAWLVLYQPRQWGFWRNLRYILYSMLKKSTFLKDRKSVV